MHFLLLILNVLSRQSYQFTVDNTLFTTLSEDLLTRKHGFISELVSNSLDAINKTMNDGEIVVKIEDNKFILRDNGIGMDEEDIVKFIGSVGGSSSRNHENEKMIGRFGMGFYSVFKYAEKVNIVTRKQNSGSKKGCMATLERKANNFTIEEHDMDFYGTEIVAHLSQDIEITENDLEEWVSTNLIHAGDRNKISLIKSNAELENERNRIIEDYNKQKEEREKKEAEKQVESEANENDEANEKKETEVVEDEVVDLNTLLSQIESIKNLKFAPWTNNDSIEELTKIYNDRFKTNALKYAQKFNFNIKQKKSNGREVNTRFDVILFVPELSMMGEPQDGKIEIFVSGTKINDPNFKLPPSLKFISAIIKSNEALITSTREGFYDSENTCKNIVNAIQKKLRDIFISKTDDEIHVYNKVIKKAYIENYQSGNTSVAEKFSGLLTFDTNTVVRSIHKLSGEIEEHNLKAKESGEKEIPAIYYTNTLISLVKETESPVFDGIDLPFLFLNDIHDEEIIKALKSYSGISLVNISTEKFENKVISQEKQDEFKDLLAKIKDILSPFVSDVFVSKRLVKLPFSIMAPKNAMSSAYKNVIGENELEKHPFRQFIDPKPILEVNLDSNEIIALKETMNEGAIFKLFLAASIACRQDIYSKAKCVNRLMNDARASLGVEQTIYEEKKDPNDFMSQMPNMDEFMKNSKDIEDGLDEKNEDETIEDQKAENIQDDVEIEEDIIDDISDMKEEKSHSKEDFMSESEIDDDIQNTDKNTKDQKDFFNADNMKDMFNADKLKDLFSEERMKEMQEMFKGDDNLKDLFNEDKMKEMQDLLKDENKMNEMLNDENFKEMLKDKNLTGKQEPSNESEGVREDL